MGVNNDDDDVDDDGTDAEGTLLFGSGVGRGGNCEGALGVYDDDDDDR